jgi:hypothetical protein
MIAGMRAGWRIKIMLRARVHGRGMGASPMQLVAPAALLVRHKAAGRPEQWGAAPMPRLMPTFIVVLVTALLMTATAHAQTLTFRGCHRLPAKEFPGLSGITYAGEGKFFGVLEWEAQVVPMQITFAADGEIETFTPGTPVKIAGGRDLEGIAFLPARGERVMISDESPKVFEVTLMDGKTARPLPVPEIFKQIVSGYGFESLTYSLDGKSLWVANERALKIDGNPQTPATPIMVPTRVRLMRYEMDGEKAMPREQFEYETSGVHDWGGTIGLCDLAALPDGRLLALERSAAKNFSNRVTIRSRVFLIDPAGATDISKPPNDKGLGDGTSQPSSPPVVKVKKRLLFDDLICDANGENLEGLCLGPKLGEGRYVVVGVVDNTDGGLRVSEPSVVSFELNLAAKEQVKPQMNR